MQLPFDWKCQPAAEQLLLSFFGEYKAKSEMIASLDFALDHHTSTRLFDWIEYFEVSSTTALERELSSTGFIIEGKGTGYQIFTHPGAQLPRVKANESKEVGIAIKVESIADFFMVRGLKAVIEGSFYSPFRRSLVSNEKGVNLWAVERRSTRSLEPEIQNDETIKKILISKELWQTRDRDNEDEEKGIYETLNLVKKLVNNLGKDMAAWIVLEVERQYWQSRNTAGQLQKNRQDHLGMGWANHDHHTFRSSRRHFADLVRCFEMLGFHCRERYYAGKEAGWGAQVMENSNCGIVLFLDVDLADDEVDIDFAHQKLPQLKELGTIGLWCALHGDSILRGGMHHLEAQFMFDKLTEDLGKVGIGMMNPFSSFTYLRQAFTAGEVWQVNPKRVVNLLDKKLITQEQADKFVQYGAVGSHLENLQRREGYKGFNQKNVNIIIKETDPRKYKQ